MPLGTIDAMAKDRLPFIPDTQDLNDKIASQKVEAFYLFQECLNKSDTDVEDDSKYSNKEKIFIAAYVAYKVGSIYLNEAQGSGTSNKIKKAKADVVEVEFQTSKESGELSKTQVVEGLRREACAIGKELNCCPVICEDLFTSDSDEIITPLIFHETLRPE